MRLTSKQAPHRPRDTAPAAQAWLDANNPTEGAKWTLGGISAMTDTGLLTGSGEYNDGPGGLSDGTRAFRLDTKRLVVPEPASLALCALTGLGLVLVAVNSLFAKGDCNMGFGCVNVARASAFLAATEEKF